MSMHSNTELYDLDKLQAAITKESGEITNDLPLIEVSEIDDDDAADMETNAIWWDDVIPQMAAYFQTLVGMESPLRYDEDVEHISAILGYNALTAQEELNLPYNFDSALYDLDKLQAAITKLKGRVIWYRGKFRKQPTVTLVDKILSMEANLADKHTNAPITKEVKSVSETALVVIPKSIARAMSIEV